MAFTCLPAVLIACRHSEVGKQNEALETLHHAILHKRWKNQWPRPEIRDWIRVNCHRKTWETGPQPWRKS